MNKILYLMFVFVGIYNFSFSQKGSLFGKDFEMETLEHIELFRQRIINDEIAEKFDTLIQSNDGYILKFQKKGNHCLYYVTVHGYLKFLCIKKNNLIHCFYGGGLEVIFELDRKNIIKWIQFNSPDLKTLRFILNWDGNSYKIRKCVGCSSSVTGYEKDINGWIRTYQKNIIFIGLESD